MSDTPTNCPNCPNCGAEQFSSIMFWCGTMIGSDPSKFRPSDFCHDRAARQKAEAEVAKVRIERCSELLDEERKITEAQKRNIDAMHARAETAEMELAKERVAHAETRKQMEVITGCFTTAKESHDKIVIKLTETRRKLGEVEKALEAACVVQTNNTDRRQWVTYSGWLAPGDSLCEVALTPKNTEAKEGEVSTETPKSDIQREIEAHAERALTDIPQRVPVIEQRDKAEKRVRELETDLEDALKGVVAIRCTKHIATPLANRNAHNDGECGGCIAEARDAALRRVVKWKEMARKLQNELDSALHELRANLVSNPRHAYGWRLLDDYSELARLDAAENGEKE